MTLPNVVRVLIARSYLVVAGVLVSSILAAMAFALIPPQYTSSGTAVLVQPKRPGLSVNPLLAFDPSLNTTTLIVVQALSAPMVAAELGLAPGRDTFTVKNGGSVAVSDGVEQPFISVTSQSSNPVMSASIISRVMDRAKQDLSERQENLHVTTRNTIGISSVVAPTPPKPVRGQPLAVMGATFLSGLLLTVLMVLGWDRLATRRIHRAKPAAGVEKTGQVERAVSIVSAMEATAGLANATILSGNAHSAVSPAAPSETGVNGQSR
jgi:capsular polysaccharide biosynthesis protein